MHTLNTMLLLVCITIGSPLQDDHVALHQADIDALESHGAHFIIAPAEPLSIDGQENSARRIVKIFIPESWRGGDEGLDRIDRIFADAPDWKPYVIILGTPEISFDRLQKLKAALPEGRFARRSPVMLGITHQPQQDAVGVLVSQVLSESSAAVAGIVAGDVITKIEDKEINDFDSLIEGLAHRKPGQSVALSVVRNGEHREIAVKLQGWYVEKTVTAQ